MQVFKSNTFICLLCINNMLSVSISLRETIFAFVLTKAKYIYISMVTNQNRLTPIFRFFLFDKFEGNTFSHNVLKNLVPSMSLYLLFRQLSKPAISHRDTPSFCYDNDKRHEH